MIRCPGKYLVSNYVFIDQRYSDFVIYELKSIDILTMIGQHYF